jgi:hypothetical protein
MLSGHLFQKVFVENLPETEQEIKKNKERVLEETEDVYC